MCVQAVHNACHTHLEPLLLATEHALQALPWASGAACVCLEGGVERTGVFGWISYAYACIKIYVPKRRVLLSQHSLYVYSHADAASLSQLRPQGVQDTQAAVSDALRGRACTRACFRGQASLLVIRERAPLSLLLALDEELERMSAVEGLVSVSAPPSSALGGVGSAVWSWASVPACHALPLASLSSGLVDE